MATPPCDLEVDDLLEEVADDLVMSTEEEEDDDDDDDEIGDTADESSTLREVAQYLY